MTESAWLSLTRLDSLLWHVLSLKGGPARREALFACGCLRRAQDWRLPDDAADAVEATERYHDGDLSRRTWLKYRTAAEAAMGAWKRTATKWEGDFREAVVNLFYPSCGWSVSDRLLHTVREISSEVYSAAFEASLCDVLRDVFGNPFRPVALAPEWRTDTVVALSRQMYESRDFSAMPILADALQDAGCDSEPIFAHCRRAGPHVRGCWVVDLVLGRA
jgi:hypothetical protein